ncbi:MAG: hypothetical protein M3Z28_02145 [Candidatus Dormibacteraeota bacterium]|nr:hypothetical protein [Candidatus Dormibacteraeota bacterium]
MISEPFDPSLRHPSTGEEELFDLIAIEVAVVGKGDKDRNVASGESSNELSDLLLAQAAAGVGGAIANKKWTTE